MNVVVMYLNSFQTEKDCLVNFPADCFQIKTTEMEYLLLQSAVTDVKLNVLMIHKMKTK